MCFTEERDPPDECLGRLGGRGDTTDETESELVLWVRCTKEGVDRQKCNREAVGRMLESGQR